MQLSAAAEFFGLDNTQKDVYLGGYVNVAFFAVGAPAALLVGGVVRGGRWRDCRSRGEARLWPVLLFCLLLTCVHPSQSTVVKGTPPCPSYPHNICQSSWLASSSPIQHTLTTHWLQVGWLADTYNRRNMLFVVAVIGQVPCLCTLWVSAWFAAKPAPGGCQYLHWASRAVCVSCWGVHERTGELQQPASCTCLFHFCHDLLPCSPPSTQVTQYWQFLFTRMLTGISVGGAFPLLYSLLSDMFPVTQR